MSVGTKSLAEVTGRAIEILSRELGAADALRFVNQFTAGYGDYTAEREVRFGQETLDQILADLQPASKPDTSQGTPLPNDR